MPPVDRNVRYSVKLLTAPSSEVVGSSAMKQHLNITDNDDDAYVLTISQAAREQAEDQTRRQFVTATYELNLDRFPGGDGTIELPRNPVQSVSSIVYTASDGGTETFSTNKYVVDADHEPARIYPDWSNTWPATRDQRKAVTITYVAGYGAPSDVPESLRSAIKLMAGDLYENREAQVSGTILRPNPAAARLMAPYRLVDVQ